MLNNEISNFKYHEFKTDSDNIVKDFARVMCLGYFSDEVIVDDGTVKPSAPSMEHCWKIVYPKPNFDLLKRPIKSFDELTQDEYNVITEDQLGRITNKVVIRCNTLFETDNLIDNLKTGNSNNDYKYLQLYMPKYLCDTETEDPFAQDRVVTDIPKCINPKTGEKDAIIRNYHWLLMRVFDVPNEDFSGPKENDIDLITGEFLTFNSASSEWSKLSWFTDFEETYLSNIKDSSIDPGGKDPIIRVPVSSSLTNKTKIKVMANVHPNRVVLSVVGNPNVDYSDNRYLISMAYIGAIDSFKGSKKDVHGNFGIFTTSSTNPSIPAASDFSLGTFHGLDKDESSAPLESGERWKVYNQTPGKTEIKNSPDSDIDAFIGLDVLQDINLNTMVNGQVIGEQVVKYTYKKREIPADPLIDSEGGRTGVDTNSIRVTLGAVVSENLTFNCMFEYGEYGVGSYLNDFVWVNIPVNELNSASIPATVKFDAQPNSIVETITITIQKNDLYKFLYKYLEAELTLKGDQGALIPGAYPTQRIRFSGFKWKSSWTGDGKWTINNHLVQLGFNEQGSVRKVVHKSKRDSYGNLLYVDYPKTFGKHTANGSTDFAMYMTDSSDFWQSHQFMFSSPEQFMSKHMYGKSAYTGEYFADRIKITHSTEGVRGVISGVISIDADSLFAFDELIVNKDYEKDINKPEETYIYVPITAPYCPFSNSPNERNGVGLLKDIKNKVHDDNSKCDEALRKLELMYADSLYYTNGKEEIFLVEEIDGLSITWESDNKTIIDTDSPVS